MGPDFVLATLAVAELASLVVEPIYGAKPSACCRSGLKEDPKVSKPFEVLLNGE